MSEPPTFSADSSQTIAGNGRPPAVPTHAALPQLVPGLVIAERFELVSPIGEGGMGVVWKATHLALQAPVAIKLLFPSQSDPEQASARFLREARASAALRSAHIIQVFDYGVHDQMPYLVMELLEGRTLEDRLEQGPMSFAETLEVMRDVCTAIGRAHDHDVIHRDLKPANIFLVAGEGGGREQAKVLDFGIAKFVGDGSDGGGGGYQLGETQTGAILGTPYYMSPEQLTESKSVDGRADLWSLGVIAFQCLTGTRPFASRSLAELCVSITSRDPTPASQLAALPHGVDRWMAKAMARDPEQRFATADALLEALIEVGTHAVDKTKPSSVREVEFELSDDVGAKLEVASPSEASVPTSRGAPSPSLGATPSYAGASPNVARQRSVLPWVLIGGGLLALVVGYLIMNRGPEVQGTDEAVAEVEDPALVPAPDDPPPIPPPPATGLGDACESAADCGWDDACVPTRCVAPGAAAPADCEETGPEPGSCACVDQHCALRPNTAPPAEAGCADGPCGLDQAAAVCVSGAMTEANEKQVVGPVCRCNGESRCEFEWVEPIACKSTKDCWVTDAPPYHPIVRPKRLRKRKFLPCKDGEVAPVCRDRQCSIIAYGCD